MCRVMDMQDDDEIIPILRNKDASRRGLLCADLQSPRSAPSADRR